MVATVEDAQLAYRLAGEALGRSLEELLPQTRQLLVLVDRYVGRRSRREKKPRERVRFTQRELREALGWGDYQLRRHLARLVELEYVLWYPSGAKNQRQYALLYDGQGDRGERFVLGLVNTARLHAAADSPAACDHGKTDRSQGQNDRLAAQNDAPSMAVRSASDGCSIGSEIAATACPDGMLGRSTGRQARKQVNGA